MVARWALAVALAVLPSACGLWEGVELAVTVAERDVARFGGEAALAARLREIATYCAGDCASTAIIADGGAGAGVSPALRRALAAATAPPGGFGSWRPLNASDGRAADLARRAGGGADAWPRYGGPEGRRIASLPYFALLDETAYAFVLHFDVDAYLTFADPLRPRRWLPDATAILREHPEILAVHPPAWQAREKLCRARSARDCAGRTFTTSWSTPVVGHATQFSARLFLVDVRRYRSLYPGLRADCPVARFDAVAAATSTAFADFLRETHGPGSQNQHWEAYASCAALLAGFKRADMCGDWGNTHHDTDRRRPPKIPRKCAP